MASMRHFLFRFVVQDHSQPASSTWEAKEYLGGGVTIKYQKFLLKAYRHFTDRS